MAEKQSNNLMRFAGLGAQLAAAICLSAWLGIWLDKKCSFATPVFVWLLPLLAIIGILISIIKESKKQK